jgi:hypothetical protein
MSTVPQAICTASNSRPLFFLSLRCLLSAAGFRVLQLAWAVDDGRGDEHGRLLHQGHLQSDRESFFRSSSSSLVQGCQIVYFQTPNPILGIGMENVNMFLVIWKILQPFGKFYGQLLI